MSASMWPFAPPKERAFFAAARPISTARSFASHGAPRATFFLCLVVFAGAGVESLAEESITLGPVTASVAVMPEKPVIGDIITLSIEVLAEAEVEVLMPEFGEALDRFSIVDFVPRQEIAADGKTMRRQDYRLQPALSGPQSIPPILIEFVDRRDGERTAPEGQDAYELLTPRLDFEVTSVLPAAANNELKPPLGELSIQRSIKRRRTVWLALAAGATALTAITVIWMRRKQHPPEVSAYEEASRRLRALRARPLPQPDQVDPFFVELSNIVRDYLEHRFSLRAPELTTEEFLEVASASPDLSSQHQQTLRAFLYQADMVKFAGHQPSEHDIRRALDAAGQFLEETQDRKE